MPLDLDFHDVYQHSRVSLWIEDYSGIRHELDAVRALGVIELQPYLDAHPEVIDACVNSIRVLDVNQYTLKMFRAASLEELIANLHLVFRGDMRVLFRHELENLWQGALEMDMETVNHALDGTPLYLQLARSVLPGHEQDWSRILISLTEISERKHALDRAAENERYAQGLFEHSPVSLWVEDYSAVKAWLDQLRAAGVASLARYLAENPQALAESLKLVRVLDVNQKTVSLYAAPSKEAFLANIDRVFRDSMHAYWETRLIDLWNGKLESEYEGVNYSLNGAAVDILMHVSPLPGAEENWERVLVAISDITERKKAEAYLSYLGTHDMLTGLSNRGYFEERCAQMQREARYPASVIMVDLNGLKQANDAGGHEAGDTLIRRAGEVIAKAAGENDVAARIGGDEFALLLPFQDEHAAQLKIAQIESLVELNNRYYGGPRLSLSLGAATGQSGAPLEQVQQQADARMYEAKRAHYLGLGREGDRRGG